LSVNNVRRIDLTHPIVCFDCYYDRLFRLLFIVLRRTGTRKDNTISELLAYLERTDLHPFERAEALNNLRGIIAAIWGSDEIRYVN